MSGKGFGVVGREGARRGGFARLASVAAVGVVGLGLVGGLSACSSDLSTAPVAQSTPLTPTVTVTATTSAGTAGTATGIAGTATRTTTSPAPPASYGPARATLDPSLVGTWDVHDLVVRIGADGTGQLLAWGCYPGTVQVCQTVSDVRVTPFGTSGARLTVTKTYALDENGHVAPVPAGADLAEQKQQVGDYSVLQPFTAATWPYSTPLTTAGQRAVYSFLRASKGQPLGDPKNELARLCRTTGSNPPRAVDPTYCGA